EVARIVRELPSTVGTLKDAALLAASKSALLGGKKGGANLTLAPRMPINVSVGATRAFAAVSLPLDEIRAIGKAHGATVNDMVLMLCSTALRRFYGKRRALPPRKSLIAAVPISLRTPGNTEADNQASMSLVSLGTHIAGTEARLGHILRATAAMKSTMGSIKDLLPTDYPSLGIPWLIEAATALYGKAKLADRIPLVANLVISNVPGPPEPLYLAGARMLTNYPASIVVHGLALNITVQSYDRSLDFGLMADGTAMPDVRDLARALEVAFDDLRELADPASADGSDAPPSLLGLARRGLDQAVGSATDLAARSAMGVGRSVMDSALRTVAAQVTGRPTKTSASPSSRTRKGKAK
ncbi:MAG: WS/DGAT domain-containing protein, partial [Rubrivivax sp.]|nr:WS/DGAT domain-containing protein [Rubrivivax sp.]